MIHRKFGNRIINLAWAEVKIAVSKGWMESDVAVDLALRKLESDRYSQKEAELAALNYTSKFEIINILEELSPDATDKDINLDKWAKIFVAWLYEHRTDLDNPIQSLEILWADFGYLDSIEKLANQYSSKGFAEKSLFIEWKKFLDDEVYSILVLPISKS